jgi:hypothetical protein
MAARLERGQMAMAQRWYWCLQTKTQFVSN